MTTQSDNQIRRHGFTGHRPALLRRSGASIRLASVPASLWLDDEVRGRRVYASLEGWRHDRKPEACATGLRRLQRAAQGFTLIEVLIAVAVFAIVLVAIHAVFYSAIKLRNKTTETIDAGLPLQQALAIMRRDLASLVPPGGILSGQLQTAILSGGGITGGSQSSPDFYTASATLDEIRPWSEVQKVSYHLELSTNNTPGLDLYRAVTRNLLPVQVDQAESQWLMGGVQTLVFSYFDGTTWRDSWDSTNGLTAPLPSAIKVQIQLVAGETQRLQNAPVELVVPLMTQVRSNQTAQATSGGGS